MASRNQLSYTIWRVIADGANGQHLDLDKTIPLPLPLDYSFSILVAAQGYLILRGRNSDFAVIRSSL
uniref:Uncharacterized protein n=1 Tax=Oryza punctata TaxID=4537 RepID=A0A0E0LM40_ORYPU